LVVALVFALAVPGEVGFEVTVADQGTEFEDGFGAGQGPAGSGDIQAVLDQVAAGAFDDAVCDRPAAFEGGAVVEVRALVLQVGADLLDSLGLLGGGPSR